MKPIPSSRRRAQKGAMMIEIALVFLTMITMVIFIFEMGRVLLLQQFVTERVRTGARRAAVSNFDATALTNIICYDSSTAPAGGNSAPGLFGIKPAMVLVERKGTAGDWSDRIKVTIHNYPVLTVIPQFSNSFALQPVVATIPVGTLGQMN